MASNKSKYHVNRIRLAHIVHKKMCSYGYHKFICTLWTVSQIFSYYSQIEYLDKYCSEIEFKSQILIYDQFDCGTFANSGMIITQEKKDRFKTNTDYLFITK